MRSGSEYMITVVMTAVAFGLVLAGWTWSQRAAPLDVERVAGRVWADARHKTFDQCPRENGLKFWMGCTDTAPAREPRR